MIVRLSMLCDVYAKTAYMCLGLLVFFGVVSLLACFLNVRRLNFDIRAKTAFWACLVPGFILITVCLTLIDEPRWGLSGGVMSWMFMLSAFLGVPVALPLLAGAAWASAHRLLKAPVRAGSFALVLLGVFALGCAASNIHDVIWCAAITNTYAHHEVAGGDLAAFVALGNKFGIASEVLSDYATLGPCAIVMVIGELTVAAACFRRLARLSRIVA